MNLDPSSPCPYPAGSPAKLAVLRERVAKRLPLFHPDDNLALAGRIRCRENDPTDDDPLLDAMRLYAPIETEALATREAQTRLMF